MSSKHQQNPTFKRKKTEANSQQTKVPKLNMGDLANTDENLNEFATTVKEQKDFKLPKVKKSNTTAKSTFKINSQERPRANNVLNKT
jgi:hypothetical protein